MLINGMKVTDRQRTIVQLSQVRHQRSTVCFKTVVSIGSASLDLSEGLPMTSMVSRVVVSCLKAKVGGGTLSVTKAKRGSYRIISLRIS